jgi:predicted AlkP superfamily pyrophosphatase or phosphodiesterase
MIKAILNLFKPKAKVTIDNPEFKNVEWAFQFNEDEPFVLATAINNQKNLVIKLRNKKNSNIIFRDNKGNEFKIFAREQKNI